MTHESEPPKRLSLVGRKAPYFDVPAVMGDGSFKNIKLSDYEGKTMVLFFFPLDFTFVCPSEIIALDKALDSFKERNCEVLCCSVDSQFSHAAWRKTAVQKGGIGEVKFPILADLTKEVVRSYGIYHSMGVALRGLFVLDSDHIVAHSIVNELALGRSVDEILRVVDAVQFHKKYGDVCPANWKKGQRAMKPTAEGVAEYLTKEHGAAKEEEVDLGF